MFKCFALVGLVKCHHAITTGCHKGGSFGKHAAGLDWSTDMLPLVSKLMSKHASRNPPAASLAS